LKKSLKDTILKYNRLLVLTFSFLIAGVSSILYINTVNQTYQNSISESVEQKIDQVEFTMDSVKLASEQLLKNDVIKSALVSDEYDIAVAPLLNQLRSSSFGIDGVTLYLENGLEYKSFNISGIPSLDTIKASVSLPEDDGFILRTNGIAQFYNSIPYIESYGMFSYVKILKSEDDPIGLLMVDVRPQYFYINTFAFDGHPILENSSTIFFVDNSPLETTQISLINLTSLSDLPFKQSLSSTVYQTKLFDDYDVQVYVPAQYIFIQIVAFVVPVVLFLVIFNLVGLYISKRLVKSIEKDINLIHEKINKSTL
jgi:hypothetical protein